MVCVTAYSVTGKFMLSAQSTQDTRDIYLQTVGCNACDEKAGAEACAGS
jgi:hypothetical protein